MEVRRGDSGSALVTYTLMVPRRSLMTERISSRCVFPTSILVVFSSTTDWIDLMRFSYVRVSLESFSSSFPICSLRVST